MPQTLFCHVIKAIDIIFGIHINSLTLWIFVFVDLSFAVPPCADSLALRRVNTATVRSLIFQCRDNIKQVGPRQQSCPLPQIPLFL